MIRFLRKLFFGDWMLKLFSLTLAILTWLAVSFSIRQKVVEVPGTPTVSERTYYDLPVVILSDAGATKGFKARPSEVDVTVQGTETTLENLPRKDIRVLVTLPNLTTTNTQMVPVQIITPAGVTHVRIEATNIVEVIPPPPDSTVE